MFTYLLHPNTSALKIGSRTECVTYQLRRETENVLYLQECWHSNRERSWRKLFSVSKGALWCLVLYFPWPGYSFCLIGFASDKMNTEHLQYVCRLLPMTSYRSPAGPAIAAFSTSLHLLWVYWLSTRCGSRGRSGGEWITLLSFLGVESVLKEWVLQKTPISFTFVKEMPYVLNNDSCGMHHIQRVNAEMKASIYSVQWK